MTTTMPESAQAAPFASRSAAPPRRRHCLRQARRSSGLSLEDVARRLGVSLEEARRQERGEVDLWVSALHRWAEALQVHIDELVVEPENGLSPPPFTRGHLIRMLKIASVIAKTTERATVKRLAQRFIDEVMPLVPGWGSDWSSHTERRDSPARP
jgi:transcriptional regulator with XRE-family HTH domain